MYCHHQPKDCHFVHLGKDAKSLLPKSLQVSEIFLIFAPSKHIIMVQDVGLNQAQMDFLRLLSHFKTEEEVRELNDLVCKYYSQKIDEEMDRLWDEGKWSHEKIEGNAERAS